MKLITISLISVASALKMVPMTTTAPPTQTSMFKALEDGYNSELEEYEVASQEHGQAILTDLLSAHEQIRDHYNFLYENKNQNQYAYVHNHGQGANIHFNNIGKDFSDVTEMSKNVAKQKCVNFCTDLIDFVLEGQLGMSSLELNRQNPAHFNMLFTICAKNCKVAYRQPKAVDEQWQDEFANDIIEIINTEMMK